MYEIYKHTNIITNKSYIGFTKHSMESRWKGHLRKVEDGSKTHFHNAIRKYSKDVWHSEVLVRCSCQVSAKKAEITCIEYYDTLLNGYNMTPGGDGGCVSEYAWNKGKPLSDEHKQKLRDAKLGTKQSDETKRKRSNSMLGKNTGKRSSEWCESISDGIEPNQIWFNNGIKEVKVPEKDIHKLSGDYTKGRLTFSESHSTAFSEAAKGRKHMNDGTINVMATPQQINHYLYRGFKFGRIMKNMTSQIKNAKA